VAEPKVESNIECAILWAVAALEVEEYDVPQAVAALEVGGMMFHGLWLHWRWRSMMFTGRGCCCAGGGDELRV